MLVFFILAVGTLNVGETEKGIADTLHVVSVVEKEFDCSVKDTIVGVEGDVFDYKVLLTVVEYIGNGIEHAVVVNTFNMDTDGEIESFVGIPLERDDIIAIARFEFCSRGTTAFVDFERILGRDIA